MTEPLPAEWPSWLQEGARLLAVPPLRRNQKITCGAQDPKFMIGDWLATVPPEFIEPLAEALDADPSSFRSYREVSSKIPPERRVAASWSVHRDLRDAPDKLVPGLTIREAAALLGKPIDSPPDRRLTPRQKYDKIRDWLYEREVYSIHQEDLKASRADRKTRRVRIVDGDLETEHKASQALQRDAIAAKRPFEASVDYQTELLRAARVVHALTASFDSLDPPNRPRVVKAAFRLDEQMDALIDKLSDVAAPIPEYIDGEAVTPARALESGPNGKATVLTE